MTDISKPSQQFVIIRDIKDGVVYLRGGGMRRILMVSGVNFDLKSEPEQNIILSSFQNFLNTLDFPVQFFIHSRKANIGSYLERMKRREQEETNELLKIQIREYMAFVQSFVEENAIINKTFFVVISYHPTVVPQTQTGFLSMFFKKPDAQKAAEDDREAIEQLDHRVDQVIDGLEQIGLRAAVLENEELIELFYNLYNPRFTEKKGLEITK